MEEGIYLPENSGCQGLRKTLREYFYKLKGIQFNPKNELYSGYRTTFSTALESYESEKNWCNKRVVEYKQLVPLFKGLDAFYFNGSGPTPSWNEKLLPYISSNNNALASIHLNHIKMFPTDYFSGKLYNEKRVGRFKIFTGKTSHYPEWNINKFECDSDTDKNGQITMNEISDNLKFSHLPEIFASGPEELFDWNDKRDDILDGAIIKFPSETKNYGENYKKSKNSAGHTVVANLPDCPIPPEKANPKIEDALANSETIKPTRQKLEKRI